jgi:hypothetical protein
MTPLVSFLQGATQLCQLNRNVLYLYPGRHILTGTQVKYAADALA